MGHAHVEDGEAGDNGATVAGTGGAGRLELGRAGDVAKRGSGKGVVASRTTRAAAVFGAIRGR